MSVEFNRTVEGKWWWAAHRSGPGRYNFLAVSARHSGSRNRSEAVAMETLRALVDYFDKTYGPDWRTAGDGMPPKRERGRRR